MASVSDNFNRANGDVGSNWTDVLTGAPGRIIITSNEVGSGVTGTEKACTYTGAALTSANHSVSVKYVAGTSCVLSILARNVGSGASRNGYAMQVNLLTNLIRVLRIDAGVETERAQIAHTATPGNVYRFQLINTGLTVFVNETQLISTADGVYSAIGAPGIGVYNDLSSDDRYDDFLASDITSIFPVVSAAMQLGRRRKSL
jgi:hypothetical protein